MCDNHSSQRRIRCDNEGKRVDNKRRLDIWGSASALLFSAAPRCHLFDPADYLPLCVSNCQRRDKAAVAQPRRQKTKERRDAEILVAGDAAESLPGVRVEAEMETLREYIERA